MMQLLKFITNKGMVTQKLKARRWNEKLKKYLHPMQSKYTLSVLPCKNISQ
jgi:hypothetical protein